MTPCGEVFSTGGYSQRFVHRFPSNSEVHVIARSIRSNKKILHHRVLNSLHFHFIDRQNGVLGFLRSWWHAINIFLKGDFIVFRCPSFLSLFFGLFALISYKRYGVEIVGDAVETTYGRCLPVRFMAFVSNYLAKLLVRNANGVVYVTSSVLQRKFPTTIHSESATNAEILNIFEPKIEYSEGVRPIKLVFVGDASSQHKGFHTLIDALLLIASMDDKLKIEIIAVGRKPPEYVISKLCSVGYSINILGSIPAEEVTYWVKSGDIYVHPSLTEGLPRALLEAMSLGLPCIASDAGGIPEFFPIEYIFQRGNHFSLSERLLLLIKNVSERNLCAETCVKAVKPFLYDSVNNRRKIYWNRVIGS